MSFELKVIGEVKRPLLNRRDIQIEVVPKNSPRRYEIRKRAAAVLGVPLECVYLRKIVSVPGMQIMRGEVHVYDSEQDALRFEPEYIIRRNQPPEEKKAEKKPKEE